MVRALECIVLLVIADIALALVNNTQIESRNDLEDLEIRRSAKKVKKDKKDKKGRSTSSSSNDKKEDSDSADESLGISDSEDIYSESKKKRNDDPKSSDERKGWRKWHRKCPPCPEDMRKKWRDPSINWICGAYQRARRTFKSLCMMHYRNCQDGTMFLKIHDHRCENSSKLKPHGDHFFYEYRVVMTDESTDSKTSSETTSIENSSA